MTPKCSFLAYFYFIKKKRKQKKQTLENYDTEKILVYDKKTRTNKTTSFQNSV